MSDDEHEMVNVRMPRSLHSELRRVAAAEDRSMSATIRLAVRRYVAAAGEETRDE